VLVVAVEVEVAKRARVGIHSGGIAVDWFPGELVVPRFARGVVRELEDLDALAMVLVDLRLLNGLRKLRPLSAGHRARHYPAVTHDERQTLLRTLLVGAGLGDGIAEPTIEVRSE